LIAMNPQRSCFVLVLMLMLDSFAREPIKSPPPTTPTKVVRGRDLGVPFEGTPGNLNSITDIPGVEVGYTTLISGEGRLEIGNGPVRTGVTAIIPRGHDSLNDPVYAGYFSLNGNGEMTGTAWLDESGFLEGPIVITNTHSVGVARDAVIAWRIKHGAPDTTGYWWSLPVVAETWDGWLNDINGFHVKPDDVFHALDTAQGGAIEEGSVGGGTGMICYEFKGGNGTASRQINIRTSKDAPPRSFIVGVFLQANFGRRWQLTVAGVPVGKEIPGEVYKSASADPSFGGAESGSCIAVVATDAPLLPNQLKRLARRVALGLAHTVETIPNDLMDPLFAGVVEATEEAVVNALVDNHSMTGRDNHYVEALPHDRLRELMKRLR
jgi:D-aminopeptidase